MQLKEAIQIGAFDRRGRAFFSACFLAFTARGLFLVAMQKSEWGVVCSGSSGFVSEC